MDNLAKEIEKVVGGEEIIAVVIGGNSEMFRDFPKNLEKKIMSSWNNVRRHFDFDYDPGYGGSGLPAFVVWTSNYVIFPEMYDGASWVSCIERNPMECDPVVFGG